MSILIVVILAAGRGRSAAAAPAFVWHNGRAMPPITLTATSPPPAPTRTPTPTPTATPGLIGYGHVRVGNAAGPGPVNVQIHRYFASYALGSVVAMTDEKGYYETAFINGRRHIYADANNYT